MKIDELTFLMICSAIIAGVIHLAGISKPETITYSNLARLIEAEAQGECLMGKYLVGSVAVNRLRDARFPGRLDCVIEEDGQFATMADSASQESIDAAIRAIKSPYPQILYFYNPATATNTDFTKRLSDCFDIGNHRFCITFK